jgi:nucleoside 2-deoxyribosyltransferase
LTGTHADSRPVVYLCSPLGFAESTRAFMEHLVAQLSEHVIVNNPWDDKRFKQELAEVAALVHHGERQARLRKVNYALGLGNEERIRASDAAFAILDGVDVDSGTAAEIGFAYALGKPVSGLRTDFRLAGDNEGAIVNLQVQYFIEASGGQVVTTADELVAIAANLRATIASRQP